MSEDGRPVVWLMIGVPYAGKSTYVATHPELSALPVLSFDDEIMHVTHGHYEKWAEAAERASELLEKRKTRLIAAGRSFVIDMTNLLAAEGRIPLIRELHAAGFAVKGIVLEPPPLDELVRRMKARPMKKVPPEAVAKMFARWEAEPPSEAEGFDELISIGAKAFRE